jgi:hAT family C-terminal dimerisation region
VLLKRSFDNRAYDDLYARTTDHTYHDISIKNEISSYLAPGLTEPITDIVAWWQSKKTVFPRLFKVAITLIAVPAQTIDIERLFSLTKLFLSDQRQALLPGTLEEMLSIRNWAR